MSFGADGVDGFAEDLRTLISYWRSRDAEDSEIREALQLEIDRIDEPNDIPLDEQDG